MSKYLAYSEEEIIFHTILEHTRRLNIVLDITQPTSTSNQFDSCSAFDLHNPFPALVTKTVGIRNFFVFGSMSFLKHSGAKGSTRFPLTKTPSISKRSPKDGFCKDKSKIKRTIPKS